VAAEHESPMHQFEIQRLIPLKLRGIDISFTNSSLFMVIAVALITLFLLYAMSGRKMVPGRTQSIAEMAYEFIHKLVQDSAGKEGLRFFPFVFTLFFFILVLNLIGLIPYTFTVTSHIIVTFAMALFIFALVTLVGFWMHGLGYLKLFIPSGVPLWLMPVIIPIELISYFIRPISHSVRLFANMMAGHTMLKVFGGFVVGLGALGGWAPLGFMVAFTGLEVVVAVLQAFIFALLTCIYLNDAIHMHH